jgi:hypothetical protein
MVDHEAASAQLMRHLAIAVGWHLQGELMELIPQLNIRGLDVNLWVRAVIRGVVQPGVPE